MKKRQGLKRIVFTGIAALLLLACSQSRKKGEVLTGTNNGIVFGMLDSFPQYGQQTGMWCWAASTQMILGYYGITVQQCELANKQFGKNDCCGQGCPPNSNHDCVHGGHLMTKEYGYLSTADTMPLPWDSIRLQIDQRKAPMAYSINAPVGDSVAGLPVKGGHVRVIKGYFTVNGTNYLIINDPMPVCQGSVYPITYNEYAHGRGNWIRTTTNYNFHKN